MTTQWPKSGRYIFILPYKTHLGGEWCCEWYSNYILSVVRKKTLCSFAFEIVRNAYK